MGGSLLAAVSGGAFRNVKGPCPALRPGRLGSAFGFRRPCLDPRPATFNSLRSCSCSRCNRSISSSTCFKRSRRTSFSCSSSSIRWKGAPDSVPAIPNYVNPKSRKCPVKNAYLPLINYGGLDELAVAVVNQGRCADLAVGVGRIGHGGCQAGCRALVRISDGDSTCGVGVVVVGGGIA